MCEDCNRMREALKRIIRRRHLNDEPLDEMDADEEIARAALAPREPEPKQRTCETCDEGGFSTSKFICASCGPDFRNWTPVTSEPKEEP